MERYEIGLVYKYYMMKGAKHEVKIHGDESAPLASAVKTMVYEEAQGWRARISASRGR
jgi:hypothetical protein